MRAGVIVYISSEDRHHIYLEEKARMEAQQELLAEQSLPFSDVSNPYIGSSIRRRSNYWGGGLILVMILIALAAFTGSGPLSHFFGMPATNSPRLPLIVEKIEAPESAHTALSSDSSLVTATAPVTSALPELQVLETHSESDVTSSYAVGTVKNNTDHDFHSVQVKINLYDALGNQVGSTNAITDVLGAGQQWKFSVVASSDNAKSWKVVNVTGF